MVACTCPIGPSAHVEAEIPVGPPHGPCVEVAHHIERITLTALPIAREHAVRPRQVA